VSKNHRITTTKVTAELDIHPEDNDSIKTARRELPKSNIHSPDAIAKPLITEHKAKKRKRWYDDDKTWTSDE